MAGLTGRSARTASPLRTLLAGAIDYAGLFPPAALPMDEAVRNYAGYRASGDSWALGRFVVPVARLGELAECVRPLPARRGEPPWPLALLAGPAGAEDWRTARDIGDPRLAPAAFELRALSPDEIERSTAHLPADLDVFHEIPIEADPSPLVAAIARAGASAKVRTGGVTPEAFPSARTLARFTVACARAAVSFKATAGLHHAIRGSYRLTYEPASATAEMFGFLNVFLAAAFAADRLAEIDVVAEVLCERDPSAFRWEATGVEWRGHQVGLDALAATRNRLVLSFGSCSFREPIDELEALGLL